MFVFFFLSQLTPVERYAMRFIEETETMFSAEQLAAAEREIEERKREWEENRLAAMREEEKRRVREMEEESDLLTFSREDATNQVSKTPTTVNTNKKVILKRRGNKILTGKGVHVVKKIKRKKVIDVKRKGKCRRRVVAKRPRKEVVVETDSTTQSSVSEPESVKVNGDDSNTKWSCDTEMEVNTESDADSDLIPLAKQCNISNITSNHIDHNSPRTRSHGTVAINLWTLDVSPILPGVKPIIKNSAASSSSTAKRDRTRNSSSEKEIDVESVDKTKKNNSTTDEKNKIVKRKRGRPKRASENHGDTNKAIEANSNDSVTSTDSGSTMEDDLQKAVSVCKETVCKVVIQDVMTTVDATKYLPKNNNKNVDLTDNLVEETEIEIAKTTDNNCSNKMTSTPKTADTSKKRRTVKNCNNTTLDNWLQKSAGKDDVLSDNSILRTSNSEPNED